MLEIKELSKVYGGSKCAVDNINFKISDGELCGLIGHNGAGKTTTLKMIMGILRPTNGKITINGKEIRESIEIKKLLSYVPDKPIVLLELTGNEYLNFIANMYEVEVEERNNLVQDLAKKFKIENDLNARLSSYSHGMRKKIMIVGAFLSGAKLLILDEPLTGLDPEAIYTLKDMMNEYCKMGNSIIFSTHLLAVAEEVCSKFIFLNKGEIKFNGDLEYIGLKYGENATVESVFMDIIKEDEEIL